MINLISYNYAGQDRIQYQQNYFLMSKHIKNLELRYQYRPLPIAHQRGLKIIQTKNRLQQLNLWKAFSRIPRANSFTSKKNEDDLIQELIQQDKRLFVISSFKGTEQTDDSSPVKNYKIYRTQGKRYISNQDLKQTKTNQGLNSIDDNQEEQTLMNQSQLKRSSILHEYVDETQKIKQNLNKRIILSSNLHEVKQKIKNSNHNQHYFKDLNVKKISSKVKLPQLKQEKKYPLLMRQPNELKQVKSQSFILIQYPSQRVIVSQKSSISLQIASLTKIMTFYTIITLAQQFKLDIKEEKIIVSANVHSITGTSADLIEGEEYTLQEMLYGLMLPSGNDAANELATWAGAKLLNTSYADSEDHKALHKLFVAEMNKQAKILQLKNTKFANAHGLPHQQSKSTAADVAKLCATCMKKQIFQKVVKCKIFKTNVKNSDKKVRLVEWENTNKLLRRQGFIGIKTGITVTAGPCLASAYVFRQRTFISVILRAPKVSGRFKETRLLLHWALNKLFKDLTEAQKLTLKKLKRHNHDLDSDNSEDERQFKYDCKNGNEYKKRCKILNQEI